MDGFIMETVILLHAICGVGINSYNPELKLCIRFDVCGVERNGWSLENWFLDCADKIIIIVIIIKYIQLKENQLPF